MPSHRIAPLSRIFPKSDAVGIKDSHVVHMENGRHKPSIALPNRFSETLGLSMPDINRVTQLLLENVTIEMPGVGGGPDRNLIWARSSMELPTPNNPVTVFLR